VLLLCNWAPRHEGVLGEWRHSPTHSLTSTLDGLGGKLHAPAALPQGKSPWYPLDRKMDGPQSRSGRGGEEKNSQPLPGIEPQNPDRPARSPALYRLSYHGSFMLKVAKKSNWINTNEITSEEYHSNMCTDSVCNYLTMLFQLKGL
jgi:hypothetical protein